jgi:hypothetical protein
MTDYYTVYRTLQLYFSELGIICYFFPNALFRYFNAAIRYRYSATFLTFAISYSLSLLHLTSVMGVLVDLFYAGLWIRNNLNPDPVPAF